MKTAIKIVFLAIAMVGVLACSDDAYRAGDVEKLVNVTFKSEAEGTRTFLVDGKKVHWEETDKISVFDNVSYSNKAFTAENVNEKFADFNGYTIDGATEYVAIYPYRSDAKYASNYSQYETKLPYHQKAVKGGYDTGINMMVARTTSDQMHLSFRNICALVKVTIPEDITDISAMTLMSSGPLAGRIMFEFDSEGEIKFRDESVSNNTLNEVTLSTENGSAMEPGDYYFVIRPFYKALVEDDPATEEDESNGEGYNIFQLGITKTNGEVKTVKSVEKAYLKCNDVLNLGVLSYRKTEDYNFKVTNAPTGPFPCGTGQYQLTWEGDDLENRTVTFSARNSDIATVSADGLVSFTGKAGVAHVYVTYDHRNFPVEFNIKQGYYRETFDVQENAGRWAADSGGSCTYVPATESSEGYNIYIPVIQTNGKYRVDAKRSGTTYLTQEFPFLCFRFDDVSDKAGASRNINIDTSGNTGSGTKYSGNLGGDNNKWSIKYKCSDGSAIMVYDLGTKAFKNGGILPVGELLSLGTFALKYADIPLPDGKTADDISYRMFWFNTFSSEAEMNTWLQQWSEETGITYSK